MKRDPQNREWDKLDGEARALVRAIAAAAHEHGTQQSRMHASGEIYAFPHPGGGISWGINGAADGLNVLRCVIAGRELEDELQRARATTPSAIERMVSFARELDDRYGVPGGEVSEERREHTRQTMAGFAGGLRSLEAEINGSGSAWEQSINKPAGSTASASGLEPQEVAQLERLFAAGTDEADFHLAFDPLRDRGAVSDRSLSRIAAAFTGNAQGAADRDAALGAIETHFYQQRRSLRLAQQNTTGARSAR